MKKTSRRRFLSNSIGVSLGFGVVNSIKAAGAAPSRRTDENQLPVNPLPGTEPLTITGDLATQMVEGIHEYLMQATTDFLSERSDRWKRDFTSTRAYQDSVASNRERLRKIIGAVDPRVPAPALQIMAASPASVEVVYAASFQGLCHSLGGVQRGHWRLQLSRG